MTVKAGSLVEYIGKILTPSDVKHIQAGCGIPQRDTPYTVREVFIEKGRTLIYLDEIHNPSNGIREVGFSAAFFRELQPPMDMSFLNEIQLAQVA